MLLAKTSMVTYNIMKVASMLYQNYLKKLKFSALFTKWTYLLKVKEKNHSKKKGTKLLKRLRVSKWTASRRQSGMKPYTKHGLK